MIELDPDSFEKLVTSAIDSLPEKFKHEMKNLAFVVEDQPSEQQRHKLKLTNHQSLFGLYEGIPLTQRGNNYNLVLPDKITIFKRVIEMNCQSPDQVAALVRRTVWHEVAHHFGLGHDRIDEIQRRS